MWKYFLVVVVVVVIVAVAPVINIRERANERTRNSFNELDFARRANSFLHLHSVLAVNHFSARVTTGRKSNSINIHFFLFFPTQVQSTFEVPIGSRCAAAIGKSMYETPFRFL